MTTNLRILLVGGSGMIGQAVLRECLLDSEVAGVVALVRTPLPVKHPKLSELVHANMRDFSAIAGELADFSACFFCLGASAAGLDEVEYARINYDIPVALAGALLEQGGETVFVYVSGAGTDSSERGLIMWARVKGRTENRLLNMPFRATYMFRPGVIIPRNGERSKTRWYRWFYSLTKPLHCIVLGIFSRHVLGSDELGRAMLNAAKQGLGPKILEVHDIRTLATGAVH
jgi:uncharacterized protein YbjT (DUF2867 family)